MKKRLVIIGNASVEINCNDFVNESDFVIRFNTARNFNAHTGERVDALSVMNVGRPARIFNKYKEILNLSFFIEIKEIWFPLPPSLNTLEKEIIQENELSSKKIIYTTKKLYKSLEEKVNCFQKYTKEYPPSSGLVAIENCIENKLIENYEIYLLGFNFQGWSGHCWSAEKSIVEFYQKRGKLKIIGDL